MLKLKGWGCVLAVAAFAVSLEAQPQASSGQHAIRAAGTVTAPAGVAPKQASAAEDSTATKLPVRRVVLYKTGVGYFEHVGRVQGDQTVRIDFTSGQLNDVLQSLTVLDLNGGHIAGVNYNSEAPMSQRLGALHLPVSETTDLSSFLGALRGARLQVSSGAASVTGRLLSIERKTRANSGTTLEVDVITVVTDAGDVRSIEIAPGVNVRLMEHDVNEEVGRYLGLLGTSREQDIRRMTIETAGTGDRQLYVSYISEVPVWKTTYRIVLPSKADGPTLLQGWAIVDNTVGEDWSNVELSLVAGAPQSFIQQLSQPFYARRPVIALPQTAQLSPQTHESAMLGGLGELSGLVMDQSGAAIANANVKLYMQDGTLVANSATNASGRYSFDNLPAGNYRAEFSTPGFNTTAVQGLSVGGGRELAQNATLQVGSVTQTVTVQAAAESIQTETAVIGEGHGNGIGSISNLPSTSRNYTQIMQLSPGAALPNAATLNAVRGSMEAQAEGSDLGDLFQYKLKDRVTIRKNESALVPIVQAHIDAEKVSLWNADLHSSRPLRALWLTNTSDLTLDEGSFSVLENEAFAGEGLTTPIKPGERRVLSYAADLGARVQSFSLNTPQKVTHVKIDHGTMIQTSEMREETEYTVRDDDTTPRTVLIEHPLRPGWLIADDGPKPDETTSGVYRFRVPVDSKASTVFTVRERRPLEARFELDNVDSDQIELFVSQKSITAEIEAALRKIIEQKGKVSSFEDEVNKRSDQIKTIYDDQARLRENLKALKGNPEERALTQRYTKQLDDQEGQLDTLKREVADFQTKHDNAEAELDKMIQSLSFDTTI
jgi:hypothetical protein